MHPHNSTHVPGPTNHQSQPNHTLLSDSYDPGDVYAVILGHADDKLVFSIIEDDRHEIWLTTRTDDTCRDGTLVYSGPLDITTTPPDGLGDEQFLEWLDSFSPRLRSVPSYPVWTHVSNHPGSARGTHHSLAVIHGRNSRQLALTDDGHGDDQDCYIDIRGPQLNRDYRCGVATGSLCSLTDSTLARLREFTVLQR
jgi:hypothetical protein